MGERGRGTHGVGVRGTGEICEGAGRGVRFPLAHFFVSSNILRERD